MYRMFLGQPHQSIVDWINGHPYTPPTPPPTPSPYFTYDSNRFITGLYQGSPNIWNSETETWEYGGSDVTDNYALGIADNAFNNSAYYESGTPPAKAVSGSLNFPNVISVGVTAFMYCNQNDMEISLPSVQSIGHNAFDYFTTVVRITIGSNIETIGGFAFSTMCDPITLTIGKPKSWVENQYWNWSLPGGSTIICTDGTIPVD